MDDITLKENFEHHKSIWKKETSFSSNISDIVDNKSYLSIIDLGNDVVPLIIKDLMINYDHWFYALEILTGQNPVKIEHREMLN